MRSAAPFLASLSFAAAALAGGYDEAVLRDHPIGRWTSNPGATQHLLHGGALIGEGPRPPEYSQFIADNHALVLRQPGASLRLPDPADAWAFHQGESISLEAWIQCDSVEHGQNAYLIGKGRTGRPGQPPHNQNWGLRLRESDGSARLSFVFRDARDATSASNEFWHRWTAAAGFLPGPGWHHVAVSYTFGQPESFRGWLDGAPVAGEWDMGGATDMAPWSDHDEVWIGTAMGGSAHSSFRGRLDEIAIYRGTLDDKAISARWSGSAPVAGPPVIGIGELPGGVVRVEIFEHGVIESDLAGQSAVNDSDAPQKASGMEASWGNLPPTRTESWTEAAFGLAAVVPKYSPRGIRRDRSSPYLIRMAGMVVLPAGENRLLLRGMRGTRVSVDGQILAVSDFYPKATGPARASDAEAVPDQLAIQLIKETALLPPGHSEALATIQGDGQPHAVVFEFFVGSKNLRLELGEPSLSISTAGAPFRLVTADSEVMEFTDEGWKRYAERQQAHVAEIAAARRSDPAEVEYWKGRHELARQAAAKLPVQIVPRGYSPTSNLVNTLVQAKLDSAGVQAAPLTDDATFLRRATLDTIGLLPTRSELDAFVKDTAADKRAMVITRLLQDPRWADQWVPYWQDVLAENPSLLKATLNNTGPFRYFLYEAFRDNWAMDRFVTALVSMEGSVQGGGSAGFAMASQNDLPMANKAQIVSSAFLAMQMKCARCHDAPNHPFDQADLFAISAMLQREPVKVPGSSLTQGLSANSHVVVSLKPGQKIDPHWPFAEFPSEPLQGVIRNPEDSRERLAAIITDPRNERFSQVVVNRLWKRLLGWGLVDPVDDWENARPSHPELLTWLGRELTTHDYDLKHVARLILESDTYQRVVTEEGSRFAKPRDRLFQAAARRRLTAEQLVDSLFQVAGKEFHCEPLNLDLDGRRPAKDFMSLGVPHRAWEFSTLSNERDRPALAKPGAQVIADVLLSYGWRDSRAEPRSTREEAPNVLQPAVLANGIMGSRITRLSDDSAFTALALHDQPLGDFISALFQQVLGRMPSEKERAGFTGVLSPGYDARLLAVPTGEIAKRERITRAVMWSNHLNPEATEVIYASERLVRAGDPPTLRLAQAWRERAEDAVWALMLTPEFVYLP